MCAIDGKHFEQKVKRSLRRTSIQSKSIITVNIKLKTTLIIVWNNVFKNIFSIWINLFYLLLYVCTMHDNSTQFEVTFDRIRKTKVTKKFQIYSFFILCQICIFRQIAQQLIVIIYHHMVPWRLPLVTYLRWMKDLIECL